MQSRNTYSLAASLLLTFAACARQEDPDLEYLEDDGPADDGGSSSGGSSSKAGSTGTSKSGSTSAGTGGSTTLPPAGSVGGKGGSKGTGGSKATGGSAGSAGSAGSSGSGGGGDEPVNMPVDGVSVTFKAGEGAEADFMGGELFVTNESAESFSLATLKIRYYFTNELNSPPTFVWQWGQFGPSSNLGGITCTGEVVEMTETTADANFYVELSCPDGDFASGSQLRTSWKAGNQGSGKLTQDGDWSYVADGEATKVVVLDGNTIIWGLEP